ncbi:MAG: chondroitinase family polysaccharide lyase [Moritella sp.]|uniref:chondroitinase family polysaccharide lyase n=1 Tax=Moritella sp. TaxID=78556 RepID=UPI0029A9F37C|nr:chondroitinase family polysaccharide lyase [Moritella sp.]MDX2321680.1 chondroitinase family polysaccharide lyase [Moritella sp.]
MKSKKLISLAIAMGTTGLMGCNNADTSVVDYDSYLQPAGVMYFFEQGMPDTIKASSDSQIQIANNFRKDGLKSLAWQLQPGSMLSFNQAIGYKPFVENGRDQAESTFVTWVYNSRAQQQKMTFVFGTDSVDQTWFDISLDFDGWRQLIIPFKDMQGEPVTGMNFMQVRTPAALDATTIYFDQMMMSIPVDPRWPTRDAVVPFVNLAADVAPNRHWLALYRYNNFLMDADVSSTDVSLDDAAVSRITAKLDSFVSGDNGRLKSMTIADIRSRYQTFELLEVDGIVTGKPLDNGNRLKIFLDKGINKGLLNESGFDTVFDVIKLRDYGEFMFAIAKLMHSDISAAEKQELTDMYLLLTRYGLTQGYESGSAVGTSHHFGYTLRALFQAHYYNRDLLSGNGLAKDVSDMMAWFAGTGRIYRPESEMTNFNVDVMNTQLRGMLYSILMQPDADTKSAWLSQFSFWLSRSINNSKGLGGGFKPDGSVFHHAQHYPAYAKGALKGLTPVVEALSRTSYAINPQAHKVLKNAVAMTEIYSNDGLILMSVIGRHPDGKQDIDLKPFEHMAMAGSIDGKNAIDTDMAEAYLRLTPKADKFSRYLEQQGINASASPTGNWAMNFANLGIQRRDDWVAAARGFSRYLVSHESYANANRYGRYINYGQLEIMDRDGQSRSFSHDGWNWNRWPGTTAVQLPIADLEAKLLNVDKFSGLEEMLMSEQTYSGALSDGDNGLFAMKLQGHPKYDASFAANKSVFFFDDRIVALGSGIQTEDAEHQVDTTLFQHALRQDSDQMLANGDIVAPGTYTSKATDKGMQILLDPDNNAYFVGNDNTITLSVVEQASFNQKNSKPTQGKFATAVINHGIKPVDGHYAYSVLIDANVQRATQFAEQLQSATAAPFVIEQQDNNAHIVWDRASNTRSYAFFNPVTNLDDRLIASVDAASMVMATQDKKQLVMHVVNPDLNLYQGKDDSQYDANGVQQEVSIYSRNDWKDNASAEVVTQIVLKGQWLTSNTLPNSVKLTSLKDGNTRLAVTTVRAEGIKLELTQG